MTTVAPSFQLYPKEEGKKLSSVAPSSANSASKVVVVGVWGNSSTGKAPFLNNLLRVSAFQLLSSGTVQSISEKDRDDPNACRLECFYDSERSIVYLNLVSIYDSPVLLSLLSSFPASNLSHSEFHQWLEAKEYLHLKVVLLLFHISHIILIHHPGNTFDLNYLKLFRILQYTKNLISSSIQTFLTTLVSQLLPDLKLSTYIPGKCVPTVFFLFSNVNYCLIQKKPDEPAKRKKMQQSLENQVKLLLKKAGIASAGPIAGGETNSNLPLLTLDPNRTVFIIPPSLSASVCSSSSPAFLLVESFFASPQNAEASTHPVPSNSSPAQEESLEDFISKAVKTVTQSQTLSSTKKFELLSYDKWLSIVSSLEELFLFSKKPASRSRSDIAEKLKSFIDPDFKFSTSRCVQALPSAKEQYFRDLPTQYTSLVHEKQMLKVMKVFFQVARGPAAEYYSDKLRDECLKVWKSGRQLCDAISLTGRACVHKFHQVPTASVASLTSGLADDLPTMDHSSGFRNLHACNCGRSRKVREDPFSFFKANEEFFEMNCCKSLSNKTIFGERELKWCLIRVASADYYDPDEGITQDGFIPETNFLYPLEARNEPSQPPSSIASLVARPNSALTVGDFLGFLADRKSSEVKKLNNQSSQTRMKDVEAPKQAKKEVSATTPQKSQKGSKRDRPRRDVTSAAASSSAVLIPSTPAPKYGYIGLEYECGMGHRFFLSLDQFFKLTSTSTTSSKSGSAFLHNDVPLYIPCSCSATKKDGDRIIAQLQRIFIVTPSNSATLPCLRAKVQFTRGTTSSAGESAKTIFDLGMDVFLPKHSFFILRLPYIYGVDGAALIPAAGYTVTLLRNFLTVAGPPP